MSLERPMSGHGIINEAPAINAGLHMKEVRREATLERLAGYQPSREVSEAEFASVVAEAQSAEARNYEGLTGPEARQEVLHLL